MQPIFGRLSFPNARGGVDPVMADVDSRLAREAADEARAEAVDECIGDAVDEMLSGPSAWMLLADMASEHGGADEKPLRRIYNRDTGECAADLMGDWTRVMLYAAPEHLPMLRDQWREWFDAKAGEFSEVQALAEKIADKAARDEEEAAAAADHS